MWGEQDLSQEGWRLSQTSVLESSINVVADKGHGLHRAQLQQCCECSFLLSLILWCTGGTKLKHRRTCQVTRVKFIFGGISGKYECGWSTCSTSTCSHFWHYIAGFALSSLQKYCHPFIWTQLFPPLAPSVMTFLFKPEQKSHSTFSIVGWKLISSRGMSCHPLSFPSAKALKLWAFK